MLATQWDDVWYESNMRWLDSYAYHPWVSFFHRYMFPFRGPVRGTLPVLQSQRFDKNINNEFFFIRRPAYYAVVYTGKTAPEWVKSRRKLLPFKEEWEMSEGTLLPATPSSRSHGWYPTQGLSIFWTPGYGNFVLGKNWNV